MPDILRASLLTKQGFPPVLDENSRVLILGTMPGEESLRKQEYYGHPRNQFWRILGAIYGGPFAETYPERVTFLRRQRLAVWDVLQFCERQGSLDQAIRKAVPNDFGELFRIYRNLRAIVFNGRKAQDLFESRVMTQPTLGSIAGMPRLLMPSTSPAAPMPLAEKIQRWRQIIDL